MENNQEKVYTDRMTEPNCVQLPDAKRLLEELQCTVNNSNDLSDEIFRYSNNIKSIPEPSQNMNKLVEKQPIGLFEMLYVEIERLRTTNSKLAVISNHLRDTIGK